MTKSQQGVLVVLVGSDFEQVDLLERAMTNSDYKIKRYSYPDMKHSLASRRLHQLVQSGDVSGDSAEFLGTIAEAELVKVIDNFRSTGTSAIVLASELRGGGPLEISSDALVELTHDNGGYAQHREVVASVQLQLTAGSQTSSAPARQEVQRDQTSILSYRFKPHTQFRYIDLSLPSQKSEDTRGSYEVPHVLTGNYIGLYTKFVDSLYERYRLLLTKLLEAGVERADRLAASVLPTSHNGATKGSRDDYLADLTDIGLESEYTKQIQDITADLPLQTSLMSDVLLTNYAPLNELDIPLTGIYEHSSSSLSELLSFYSEKSYDEKSDLLMAYLSQLDITRTIGSTNHMYEFELNIDSVLLSELQNISITKFSNQYITPYLGYETPSEIEDVGLTEVYESCFDDAGQVYSKLFEIFGPTTAQYACLLGHRARTRVRLSGQNTLAAIAYLKSFGRGTAEYRLGERMKESVAHAHPLVAASV